MLSGNLLQNFILLIPLVLSLSVHEWAHAYSAYRLGDDTAALQGRLTLNPLAHIDPIGTFLLPLLGIPFGWARPVPVNPARFRRSVSMSTGMAITAAAGPISNLVLAVLATVGYGAIFRFSPATLHSNPGMVELLSKVIQLNVGLALFNLLPVPPLDGSRLVDAFVPSRLRPAWEGFARIGPFALLLALVAANYVLPGPMAFVTGLLGRLLRFVAVG